MLLWFIKPFTPPPTYSELYAQNYTVYDFPEVKSTPSHSLDSLEQQALLFLKSKDYPSALSLLEQLVSTPEYTHPSQAHLWTGMAFMELEQYEEAILAFNQVVDERQTADWYTALAYLALEDKIQARQTLGKGICLYFLSNTRPSSPGCAGRDSLIFFRLCVKLLFCTPTREVKKAI